VYGSGMPNERSWQEMRVWDDARVIARATTAPGIALLVLIAAGCAVSPSQSPPPSTSISPSASPSTSPSSASSPAAQVSRGDAIAVAMARAGVSDQDKVTAADLSPWGMADVADLRLEGAEPAPEHPVWLVLIDASVDPGPSGGEWWTIAVDAVDGHIVGTATLYS